VVEVFLLGSPAERWKVAESFDPLQSTWIVPDLKAKQYLQKLFLERHACLPEESVMRASEFWRKLFARSNPEFRFISSDFAETLASTWLDEREDWVRTPNAARTALFYMSQLLPVLSHVEGPRSLLDWFKTSPEATERWSHWFIEAYFLWNKFQEEKLISPGWASGMLLQLMDTVHLQSEVSHWKRDLIVDLGVHVQPAEIELFTRLSKICPIRLLQPNPDWAPEYKKMFHSYQFVELFGARVQKAVSTSLLQEKSKVVYKKMTTQLAETKEAVAQVREWIEAGVRPSKIAILGTDLKKYWQSLSWYLKEEGVQFIQSDRVSASTFSDVSGWLAQMRVHLGSWKSSDLQASLFGASIEDGQSIISFERFIYLYEMVYDADDLDRSAVVSKYMQAQRTDPNEIVLRDAFIQWALLRWKSPQMDRLGRILQKFLQDVPAASRFKISVWHKYLERVAQNSEIELSSASNSGVACAELHSAEHLDYTHAVILGLSESALKKTSRLGIVLKDIHDIERALGFSLPDAEDRKLEFELRWILEEPRNYLALNSVADFEGQIDAASTLWIKGAHGAGVNLAKTLAPRETRWDTIHGSDKTQWAHLRGWSEEHGDRLQRGLRQDLGLEPTEVLTQVPLKRVSASTLEDYIKCPFIFASKKMFGLEDKPSMDLELDPMNAGRLSHKVLELLLSRGISQEWTESDLEKLVDECVAEREIPIVDSRIWLGLKKKYVMLGKRFISFEREWKTQFPATQHVGFEIDFSGYIDPETGALSKSPTGLPFRGTIDRLDTDGTQNVVLIDYKSSKTENTDHHGKWRDSGTLQLGLYAAALESGLVKDQPYQVQGAVYYILKDFKRQVGFLVEEESGPLYHINSRMNHKISAEEKRQLLSEVQATAASTLKSILSGQIPATPHKVSTCPTCRWNTLCRGSHLL
jgi:ATP-dependent helicase/nuclease subunit B